MMTNRSNRSSVGWMSRLGIGFIVGLEISLVDNFLFAGEVSPIVIVALLLAVAFASGAKWGWLGWFAAAGMWICIPAAHLVKHVLDLPDTLHPNTYTSILMLAAFTLVVAAIGFVCGALSRKLWLRRDVVDVAIF